MVLTCVISGYAEGSDIGAAGETYDDPGFIDEELYAEDCPSLSPDDTVAYASDEECEDEDVDGSEALSDALPYMAMAVAAYKSTSMVESMQDEYEGFVARSQVIQNVIDPTHLFGVGKTDTEVHVSILEDESVVLAFRGTEPTEWSNGFADVLTDLAQGQEPVKLCNGSSQPVYSSSNLIRAHRGFQLGLKDVTDNSNRKQNLLLVLEGLGMAAEDVRRVVCVGHSLGGALATLAAKWCREVAFPEANIGCVTIGSPRVGNVAFAMDFSTRVVNDLDYRVVNKRDVVPCVPNLLSYPNFGSAYKHVCRPIYLVKDEVGQITARLGGRRPTIINMGFLDHMGTSYMECANFAVGRS